MDKPWSHRNQYSNSKLVMEELFWEKVKKGNGDECWEWLACKDPKGYGLIKLNGRNQFAHRIAWILTYGEIPDGLFALHKCDNPPCVRPDHIFLGTQADNRRDCVEKGRQIHGEMNWNAKLTKDQVMEIRELYLTGNYTKSKLGKLFNVSPSSIYLIIAHKNWK